MYDGVKDFALLLIATPLFNQSGICITAAVRLLNDIIDSLYEGPTSASLSSIAAQPKQRLINKGMSDKALFTGFFRSDSKCES